MFLSALKFIAGGTIATVLWVLLTPAYNSVVAIAAQPLLRIDPRLRNVEVRGADTRIQGRGNDEHPEMPRVLIPAGELTYNFVLFAGLFATNPNLLRDRNFRRLLIAMLILFATHVLAVTVALESTYSTRVAGWSDVHYSPVLQDFWSAAEYAYRLAGMFAIAFGCWWIARSEIEN